MREALETAYKAFGAVVIFSMVTVLAIAAVQYYTTEGYTQVWPGGVLEVVGTTIITGANCTALVADTSEERALAISDALANRTGERPDTWTSWATTLRSFNLTLETVQIQRFDGKFFYSDVLLRGLAEQEKLLRLDMRPSDAITLALRLGAPIYINSTLLQESGIDICKQSIQVPKG